MLLASLLLVQYSTHSNAVGLMAASHRPRVYVLPDDAGYVRGASRLTLGPPVRRSAFLYATHTLQADMGAPIVPVLYDAIAEHYAAPAWTADLFFAFVPLPYYPPPDVDLGQGSLLPSFTSQWCAHVKNATRRLKSVYEHAAAARKEKGEPRSFFFDWESCDTAKCDTAKCKHECDSAPPRVPLRNFVITPAVPGPHGRSLQCDDNGHADVISTLLWFDADKPHKTLPPKHHRERVTLAPVPFMSSIRWSASLDERGFTPPWQQTARSRQLLMSFVGSTKGTAGSARYDARQWVARGCESAGPSICQLLNFDATSDASFVHAFPEYASPDEPLSLDSANSIHAVFELKTRSLFCIEPPGHSPGRKSLIDSLLSGCVPVLLMDHRMSAHFDQYLPWHFEWRRQASVTYEVASLLIGKNASTSFSDFVADLARLRDNGEARRMQRAIAANAHRLVFSPTGHYRNDDAIGSLLRGLLEWIR